MGIWTLLWNLLSVYCLSQCLVGRQLHNEATKLILNRRHSTTVGRHRNCSIVPLQKPRPRPIRIQLEIPGQVNVRMMSPVRLPTSSLNTMHRVAKDDDVLAIYKDNLRGKPITGRCKITPLGAGDGWRYIETAGCLANWNLLWKDN